MFDTEERLRCPKCRRISTKLVSLTDDGKAKKLCKTCKRKYRTDHPEIDFRKLGRKGNLKKIKKEKIVEARKDEEKRT